MDEVKGGAGPATQEGQSQNEQDHRRMVTRYLQECSTLGVGRRVANAPDDPFIGLVFPDHPPEDLNAGGIYILGPDYAAHIPGTSIDQLPPGSVVADTLENAVYILTHSGEQQYSDTSRTSPTIVENPDEFVQKAAKTLKQIRKKEEQPTRDDELLKPRITEALANVFYPKPDYSDMDF